MRKFFELLSIPILVIPVTLIILWILADSSLTAKRWFYSFFLNVVVLPLLSIVWLERRSFVSDLDLKNKRERLAFLGLMVFVSALNFLNSQILSAPKVIQELNLLVLFLIAFMGLVTSFWKISGHMLILTAVITTAYYIKGGKALLWLAVLPLAAAHRVYFKHHTPWQVVGGLVCGFLIPFFMVIFFGLK